MSSHGLFDDEEENQLNLLNVQHDRNFVIEDRVDEELNRWFADTQRLQIKSDGDPECVLAFWKRQHDHGIAYLIYYII
jgi:hypothetical protein